MFARRRYLVYVNYVCEVGCSSWWRFWFGARFAVVLPLFFAGSLVVGSFEALVMVFCLHGAHLGASRLRGIGLK